MIEKKNVTGNVVLNYVKQELAKGRSLSAHMSNLPLEKGEIYALVPDGTPPEALYSFGSGGVYSYEEELNRKQASIPIKNESRPMVVQEILMHLTSSTNNCCLFEEELALPTDPWITASGIKYVYYQANEILYFFDNSYRDEKEINMALKQSESYIFLCALSSLETKERDKFKPYKEIALRQIELFVKNITSFFVKAYDGEGYLMWRSEER